MFVCHQYVDHCGFPSRIPIAADFNERIIVGIEYFVGFPNRSDVGARRAVLVRN